MERLVNSLNKVGEHKFKHLTHMAEQRYGQNVNLKLLTKNDIYPYNYLNSMNVLNDTLLPLREAFLSNFIVLNVVPSTMLMLKQCNKFSDVKLCAII